jgi:nucleoside-diphosphate-sugar epimerase
MHNTNAPQSTVLLCGGQGFIGQALARQLRAQGMRVIAASRRSQPPLQFARMQQPATSRGPTVPAWRPCTRPARKHCSTPAPRRVCGA